MVFKKFPLTTLILMSHALLFSLGLQATEASEENSTSTLSQQEPTTQSNSILERWKDRRDLPHVDEAGNVVYFFGGSLPTIVCSPTNTCALELQEGEKISANGVSAGDSIRWKIDITSKGSGDARTPLLLIKPIASGIKTNLIVVTDKRNYNIRLIARKKDWMPMVSFDYPEDLVAIIDPINPKSGNPNSVEFMKDLDFSYDIYGSVKWMPDQIYHNGHKTILTFPKGMPSSDVPVLVVQSTESNDKTRGGALQLLPRKIGYSRCGHQSHLNW